MARARGQHDLRGEREPNFRADVEGTLPDFEHGLSRLVLGICRPLSARVSLVARLTLRRGSDAAPKGGSCSLMKRLFPVLLGALVGAIGLPVLMRMCIALAAYEFPRMVGLTPYNFALTFLPDGDGFVGATLGAWSVILWRSRRGFWVRAGSTIWAFYVAYIYAKMLVHFRDLGATWPQMLLFVAAPLWLPLVWASALFFFAILAKRRANVALS